jgi:hypothetical protein
VKKRLTQLMMLGGLVVLLAGAGWAQEEVMPTTRVSIPFEFSAGSVDLPAGLYTFNADPVNHYVAIEEERTGRVVYVSAEPASPTQNGKSVLTFKNVGGEYKLETLKADTVGLRFPLTEVGPAGTNGAP